MTGATPNSNGRRLMTDIATSAVPPLIKSVVIPCSVHTLAGTSGTVKIAALSDLGYAFEKALQKLATSELSEA